MFKFNSTSFDEEINPAQVVSIKCKPKRLEYGAKYYPNGVMVRKGFIIRWQYQLPAGYYQVSANREYWHKYDNPWLRPTLEVDMANSETCLNYYGRTNGSVYSWDYGILYNTDEEMWEDARRLREAVDNSIRLCQYKP